MIENLRRVFFQDMLLKVFSLALAILIWLTVSAVQRDVAPLNPLASLSTESRIFSNLPVVVMSSAEDVRNFRVSPNEVEVTVLGDPRILNNLHSKDIHVLVDLTGIQAAGGLLKRIEVSTPSGVTHVRVSPQEVQVLVPPSN